MTVSNSRFIYDTFPAFFMSWNSRLIFQYRLIILDLVQPCPADMDGIFSSLLSDNIDLQDNVVKDNAKSDLSGQSQCVFKSVFPGWVTTCLVLVTCQI